MEGICGYVLAGGRSSRMGTDKAQMRLGALTLLEIAVEKLQQLTAEVIVVGQRDVVPAGVRVIPDLRPGCGPMGGIEAALLDARQRPVLLLPVDMPFVPTELLREVVRDWAVSAESVCLAVADGRPQPLLSLLRPEVLPAVRGALDRGEFKVRPVLEAAGEWAGGVLRTVIDTGERGSVWPGWLPSDGQWAARELWFANLNTPGEFQLAGRLAGAFGM